MAVAFALLLKQFKSMLEYMPDSENIEDLGAVFCKFQLSSFGREKMKFL